MNILKNIRRGIDMLINGSTAVDKLGVTPITSDIMSANMSKWRGYYLQGGDASEGAKLGLPAQIAGEIARLMLLEFEVQDVEDSERWKLVKTSIDRVLSDLAPELEKGLAVGGLFIKPYVNSESVAINLIPQDEVIVFDVNDDKVITGAAFVETIIRNDKVYTRLESHYLNGTELTISNQAYSSKDSSNPYADSISLDVVPEWAMLEPEVTLQNVAAPLYGYFKVSIGNNIDPDSPLGISVYSRAMSLIPEADRQFSRMVWEYEATEAAVHVSSDAMKSRRSKDGTFKSAMPEGKERLYRTVESSGLDAGTIIDVYSPAIRDTNYITGLNQILMLIEAQTGLTRGTLSNDKMTDSYSNELELKLTRNRAENTIHSEQKNLAKAINDTIVAIYALLDVYTIGAGDMPEADTFVKFGDSIIIDDTSRLEAMRQDVNDGILPKWKYIQEKYNTTEEEAKELATSAGDADPVAGLFGNN